MPNSVALILSGFCECSNRIGTCPSLLPEDWMNHDDANGSCVVEAVLKQLNKSELFQQDHRFMRRMAFVETRDGRETVHENVTRCHKRVGIWGMTQFFLQIMKHQMRLVEFPELNNVSRHICEAFGVNMTGHERPNLRNPLVSGIVARFYLLYLTVLQDVEFPESKEHQATFWQSQYRLSSSPTLMVRFEERVIELEGMIRM